MQDLNARMGALSLHTSSTDSLLARVARLPAELVEEIYKQFLEGVLKRVRAKGSICRKLLYKGWGPSSAFGAPPRWRLGNASRNSRPWKRTVLDSLLRYEYITQAQYNTRLGMSLLN
jgi:hypothetical protein